MQSQTIQLGRRTKKKQSCVFVQIHFLLHIVVISELHKNKSFLYLNFLISFYIVHIEPAVFKLNNLNIKKKNYIREFKVKQ